MGSQTVESQEETYVLPASPGGSHHGCLQILETNIDFTFEPQGASGKLKLLRAFWGILP